MTKIMGHLFKSDTCRLYWFIVSSWALVSSFIFFQWFELRTKCQSLPTNWLNGTIFWILYQNTYLYSNNLFERKNQYSKKFELWFWFNFSKHKYLWWKWKDFQWSTKVMNMSHCSTHNQISCPKGITWHLHRNGTMYKGNIDVHFLHINRWVWMNKKFSIKMATLFYFNIEIRSAENTDTVNDLYKS